MKIGSLLGVLFCTLISFAHLFRLVWGFDIVIADVVVPMWPSALAVIGPGIIAFLLWRESRPTTK